MLHVLKMDKAEKRKLANEKRLKAVQEWRRNRNQNVKFSENNLKTEILGPQKKLKKIYDEDDNTLQKSKADQLKLFDSDDDKDEDFSDCFKIRPQFEGKNGLLLLEKSSELEDRFKLDERFKEDEEEEVIDHEEDSEQNKNIRILESILGHEVSKKHPTDINLKRKKEFERFDPEDNNTVHKCEKEAELILKKPRKKEKKEKPPIENEEIPYSSERYIEVTSNLKDIINSAGSFSFTEKFNLDSNLYENKKDSDHIDPFFDKSEHEKEKGLEVDKIKQTISKSDFSMSTALKDPFFISDGDERLNEGLEFFKRPKSLDEIRDEWAVKRNQILEIFRMKKKYAIRKVGRQPKKMLAQKRRFSSRR